MNNKKLYLISFGASDVYRLECDASERLKPLLDVEKELNSYLKAQFPNDTFTYFATPKVAEVDIAQAAKYADYHPLDAEAVKEIKEELRTEIENRAANLELDRNAPFNTVGPDTCVRN